MKKILSIVLGLMLLTACGPNREKELENIEQHEKELSEFNITADVDKAHNLIDLYRHYVETFPDDSLSPIFMFRAAEISINIGEQEYAVAVLDSIIDLYPGYEELPACQFMKGQAYESNQQYDLAREAYTEFVEKYPDHYLAADTRKMIPLIGLTPEEQLEAILNGKVEQ